MARGFLQRIIELQCTYGFPEYDILEVENPANTTKFAELLEELEETRNVLLVYRMIHHQRKDSRYSFKHNQQGKTTLQTNTSSIPEDRNHERIVTCH